MPEKYLVTIDNEEQSTQYLSVTGTVDGASCAATIRLRVLPADAKQAKRAKHLALITAYLNKRVQPKIGAETVTV